jgi:hypothetical protein
MLQTHPASVTFPVDAVSPAREPLATCKASEAVQGLLDAPDSRFAEDESTQGNPTHGRVEACWSYSLACVSGIQHHPLIAAAHLAFSQHRPLILSPDAIWVTIAQGVAQHLRLDPEKHRHLFVRHEGRKQLTVEQEDMHRGSPENPWPEVVRKFAALLRQEVGPLADRFVSDFSTTGPVERVVSEVVLLDVLQPYYSYNVVCICGIPSVTLEGTPGDWQNLRNKVELLVPLGLDWWLGTLRSLCDQFVRAASGDVDADHWKRLYKIRAVYGGEVINGWLGKLFPYTKDYETGEYSRRNALLDPEVEAEIRKLEKEEARNRGRRQGRFHAPGISAECLPRGLSRVPFICRDARGERAMEFLAGAVAVTQQEQTLGLRPTLGWAVREAAPIEQALLQLAKHEITPVPIRTLDERVRDVRSPYVPTDVIRFFQATDGATLHSGLYRIFPSNEWGEPEWCQKWETLGSERVRISGHLPRFAQLADGTELLIRLYCPEETSLGAVFVGRSRDGAPLPDTGRRVARSFTDFLLRALASGEVPYFRSEEFVTPGPALVLDE